MTSNSDFKDTLLFDVQYHRNGTWMLTKHSHSLLMRHLSKGCHFLWPWATTQGHHILQRQTSVSETIRKPPLVKAQTALKNHKIKYDEKRFSIWRMELLHPAMWRDHDIDFARWLHPAMWHVALESWQWIHQVAAPCSVAGGSGMTCHGIRPNVRHIGIIYLVSIVTISPQSTCHSAPVCEILSKSDHP